MEDLTPLELDEVRFHSEISELDRLLRALPLSVVESTIQSWRVECGGPFVRVEDPNDLPF